MRTAAPIALALLCAPAFADGLWKFEQGSTYTWQGTTEFHYEQAEVPGSSGGTAFGGGPTYLGDPQWETVTLKATVLSVDPDGAGHLEFVVEAVHIETRFDTGGEHAEWDSSKEAEPVAEGYKRYRAILGHRFKAVVAPDGAIRFADGVVWNLPMPGSEAAPKKMKGSVARVEMAARVTHDPTPPTVWLNLIFGTTPARKSEWTGALKLPQDEKLSFKADGEETIGAWRCARSKLESIDKRRVPRDKEVKAQEGTSVEAIGAYALGLCDVARKRGTVWFSKKSGCLVRTEIEAATEYSDGFRMTNTHFKWGIELKSRGTTDEIPVEPGSTPTK